MTTQTLTQKTIDAKSGWRPPTGMAGAAFWLTVWFCLLWFLRLIPGMFGSFFSGLQILVGFALIGVTVPLLLRLVRRHMLWSLRNKLVLTYLLIGLAPVILFVTLVTISGYVAAGQFAIHLADTRLQAELSQMADENANRTRGFAQYMDSHGLAIPQIAPQDSRARGGLVELDDPGRTRLKRETTAFLNGVPLSLEGAPVEMGTQRGKTPFGLPPWAAQLPGAEFHGLVLDGGELYLVAVHQHRLSDGHVFSMMSSLPVDGTVMDLIANGLGRTGLLAGRAGTSSNSPVYGEGRRARGQARKGESAWISGGNAPRGLNLADIRVRFLSTVSMTDWDTGESGDIPIEVTSRPSLLYRQLFGTSLGGIVTSVIRTALIALCVVFLLIELLALVLAIRLSKTITASVADLYEATLRIDRGELNHRIGVEREDQLAELSRSFNRMTGSLQRLLVEQQEKEQMQNELSIAQEVQANLFPRQDCDLPTLQLHGVCRPARTVSGER